jgi:hypothetical protein
VSHLTLGGNRAATAAASENSRCRPADRRSASPRERAIPRASVDRFPAAVSYVRRLFRLVKCSVGLFGPRLAMPGR